MPLRLRLANCILGCAFLLLIALNINCQVGKSDKIATEMSISYPLSNPVDFMPELTNENEIIHRGILNDDTKKFYCTISDTTFNNFDIRVWDMQEEQWNTKESTNINTEFNEHGFSFSSKGDIMYFSSTRPVKNLPNNLWRIWKSTYKNESWTEPAYLPIIGFEHLHVSHPTISDAGNLYFHSSNEDYSEMNIFCSKLEKGIYGKPEKLNLLTEKYIGLCTPYISPDERFIIYAGISENLDLNISFKTDNGEWGKPRLLSESINFGGQGNPYLVGNGKYLMYAMQDVERNNKWFIKWLNIERQLSN